MTQAGNPTSLLVERHVPVGPAEVFDAWTDPEKLMKWWGPPHVECTFAEVDLRVGGAFRLANRLPDGETIWITGTYTAIDQPHRIEHTWQVEGKAQSPGEHVVIEFRSTGTGTDVRVTHTGMASEELRADHEGGWVGCLDGLGQLFRPESAG